jgi:hypothetical protein
MAWNDLKGTLQSFFKLGLTGVRLKNSAGNNLAVRNSGDTADAEVTASKVNISGDGFVINSDAVSSGADYAYNLNRPTAGMVGAVTLTLPIDDGSPAQVLATDGSGVLSWATVGGSTDKTTVDTTTLAFGSTSPLALFTLPANAIIGTVQIIVDTAFNGAPSVSIGVTGTLSKYVASTQVDLTSLDRYIIYPQSVANGSAENLIATYSAGAASVGSARILVSYSIPS